MTYLHWLIVISIAFVALERVAPWREEQQQLREGWLRDLGFLSINGHLFAVWVAPLNGAVALAATRALQRLGIGLEASPIPHWPFVLQFLVLLVVADFFQWCIHNLLHRVPWLWTFHKVHHSVTTMDWVGNWRFHWLEIVVYRALQWLPLVWLGASPEAVMAVAIATTIWGDFNHSNINVDLGRLGYVLNNPRMHLWHHDASDEGGTAKNFGIVFSLWDFLFGTAYWPRERSPNGSATRVSKRCPRASPGRSSGRCRVGPAGPDADASRSLRAPSPRRHSESQVAAREPLSSSVRVRYPRKRALPSGLPGADWVRPRSPLSNEASSTRFPDDRLGRADALPLWRRASGRERLLDRPGVLRRPSGDGLEELRQ